MNYASTNEANNHDNDFPVMTGDDIVDMVCKKVASAPASVDDKPHLFKRVQDILDLAEYYLPGELAENSVKVSTDIEEFRNYAAISKKRIEDLEAENARLQGELDAAQAQLQEACMWLQLIASGLYTSDVKPFNLAKTALDEVQALKASK